MNDHFHALNDALARDYRAKQLRRWGYAALTAAAFVAGWLV